MSNIDSVPVLAVPHEILAYIFRFYTENSTEEKYLPPVRLSHTCRRWRNLVLATTSLWTELSLTRGMYPHDSSCRPVTKTNDLHRDCAALSTYLQRSGEQQLSLCIRQDYEINVHTQTIFPRLFEELTDSFIPLLTSFIHRCRHLVLDLSQQSFLFDNQSQQSRVIFNAINQCQTLHELEVYSSSYRTVDVDPDVITRLTHFTFHVRTARTPLGPFTGTQLRFLDLSHPCTVYPWFVFIRLANRLVHLETLLIRVDDVSIHNVHSTEMCKLPALRRLDIEIGQSFDTYDDVTMQWRVLHFLNLPSLTHLSLSAETDSWGRPMAMQGVQSFFKLSPLLESLSFRSDSAIPLLLPILEVIPQLLHLVVTEGDIAFEKHDNAITGLLEALSGLQTPPEMEISPEIGEELTITDTCTPARLCPHLRSVAVRTNAVVPTCTMTKFVRSRSMDLSISYQMTRSPQHLSRKRLPFIARFDLSHPLDYFSVPEIAQFLRDGTVDLVVNNVRSMRLIFMTILSADSEILFRRRSSLLVSFRFLLTLCHCQFTLRNGARSDLVLYDVYVYI